jgi:hypothetical protein
MSQVLNLRADDSDPTDPVFIAQNKLATFDRNSLKFCCESLNHQLTRKCDMHGWDCPDYFIKIGIGVKGDFFWMAEARNAAYGIDFCPFCGQLLPKLEIP